MARLFDGLTDEISLGTDLDNRFDGGGTEFQWFFADDFGGGGQGRFLQIEAADAGIVNQMFEPSAGTARVAWVVFTTMTTGIWKLTDRDILDDTVFAFGYDYDDDNVATDPVCFIDGASAGVTETTTPTGTYDSDAAKEKIIGNRAAADRGFDGWFAHWANWDTILSAAKHAALSRGVNPFIMDNENLLMYLPLHGNDDPEPDYTQNITTVLTGTTKATTNPPVELLENYF